MALKVIHRTPTDTSINNELQCIPGVVHPRRAIVGPTASVIQYELASGSLLDFINHCGVVTLHQAAFIARQVLRNLAQMHDSNFIHRDITTGNVLMWPNGDVCLADPSIARPVWSANLSCTHYTPHMMMHNYIAPEVLLNLSYGKPVDMYSVGCLVAEVLQGKLLFPFAEERMAAHLAYMMQVVGASRLPPVYKDCTKYPVWQAKRQVSDLWSTPSEFDTRMKRRYSSSPEASRDLATAFVFKLLSLDPADRPTATEALEDPWLATADNDIHLATEFSQFVARMRARTISAKKMTILTDMLSLAVNSGVEIDVGKAEGRTEGVFVDLVVRQRFVEFLMECLQLKDAIDQKQGVFVGYCLDAFDRLTDVDLKRNPAVWRLLIFAVQDAFRFGEDTIIKKITFDEISRPDMVHLNAKVVAALDGIIFRRTLADFMLIQYPDMMECVVASWLTIEERTMTAKFKDMQCPRTALVKAMAKNLNSSSKQENFINVCLTKCRQRVCEDEKDDEDEILS